MTFHLWEANLAGAVPKRGDAIRDAAGVSWTVREVLVGSQGERFACSCRRAA
jgi:hypothetical protein